MRFDTIIAAAFAVTVTTSAAPLNQTTSVPSPTLTDTIDLATWGEEKYEFPRFQPDPQTDEDGLKCFHKMVDTPLYIALETQCYDIKQFCYKEYLDTMVRYVKWCKMEDYLGCRKPELIPDPRDLDYCARHEIKNYLDIIINKRPDKNFEDRIWIRPEGNALLQKLRFETIRKDKNLPPEE